MKLTDFNAICMFAFLKIQVLRITFVPVQTKKNAKERKSGENESERVTGRSMGFVLLGNLVDGRHLCAVACFFQLIFVGLVPYRTVAVTCLYPPRFHSLVISFRLVGTRSE